jgi:hypothetical protein
MKQLIAILVAIIFVFSFGSFGIGRGGSKTKPTSVTSTIPVNRTTPNVQRSPSRRAAGKSTRNINKHGQNTGGKIKNNSAQRATSKRAAGKFIKNKDQVRQNVLLNGIKNDDSIKKDSENIPPQDARDVHPATQL